MYNHLLDAFILVADEKSINKASEKLFISPVSVMKQIRKLEEEFGLKLFNTTNKGCSLTEDGKEFYKAAKDVIEYSKKATKKIVSKNYSMLKVGISLFDNGETFFDKWKQIEDEFPSIKLNLIPIEGSKENLNSLRNKEVDFVLGLDDFYMKEKCESIQIGVRRFMLVVPRNHKLAKYKSIKIDDLNDIVIEIPKQGLFVSFDELINEIKRQSNAKFNQWKLNTNVADVMNYAVNNNVPFFATDSLDNKHPALVTIPLEFGKDVPYCLFYTKRVLREHPEVRDMLNAFKELIGSSSRPVEKNAL